MAIRVEQESQKVYGIEVNEFFITASLHGMLDGKIYATPNFYANHQAYLDKEAIEASFEIVVQREVFDAQGKPNGFENVYVNKNLSRETFEVGDVKESSNTSNLYLNAMDALVAHLISIGFVSNAANVTYVDENNVIINRS